MRIPRGWLCGTFVRQPMQVASRSILGCMIVLVNWIYPWAISLQRFARQREKSRWPTKNRCSIHGILPDMRLYGTPHTLVGVST